MTLGPADPGRELAELQAYLGADYDERRLQGHEQVLMEELDEIGDEQALYRQSQMYLYDLTVFAMSQTKRPYLELLVASIPAGARILDYGCGIGTDGLALLEAGYDVTFADFDNPSVAYLRWRLEHRGLTAPIVDLDAGPPSPGFALVYAFDVIEHVSDPVAFLTAMEDAAASVLVNCLEPLKGETTLHHDLDVDALLAHCCRFRLREHQLLHRRSHLVLYDVTPARRRDRLRNSLRARYPQRH